MRNCLYGKGCYSAIKNQIFAIGICPNGWNKDTQGQCYIILRICAFQIISQK